MKTSHFAPSCVQKNKVTRINITKWAWDADINSSYDRLTLLALSHIADKENISTASFNELAEMTGASKRTVISSLKNLEQADLIERVKSKQRCIKGLTFKTNCYILGELNDA